MAGAAVVGGRDVIGRFADGVGDDSAVAVAASADCLGVVEPHNGDKGRGDVAGFADIGRGDVSRRFACSLYAVVTLSATGGDTGMIKRGSQPPGSGAVTVLARPRSGNMVRRFSGGGDAVVATRTGALNLVVVDVRGNPGRVDVAGFTEIAGAYMGRALAGGDSSPVVAGCTGFGGFGVSEQYRQPAGGGMATIAVVLSHDMVGGFADGLNPVVAGLARADHLGVIDAVHRAPAEKVVAGPAVVGGGNVIRPFPDRHRADSIAHLVAVGAGTTDLAVIEPDDR